MAPKHEATARYARLRLVCAWRWQAVRVGTVCNRGDPKNSSDVSVASLWEIAIKVGTGKWPEAEPLLTNIEQRLALVQIGLVPISVAHVRRAGLMQSLHRDPFDWLLAAQTSIETMTVVTTDLKLAGLGVSVFW